MRLMKHSVLAIALLACVPAPAARAGGEKEETPCANGAERVGDLGITSLDCDCRYDFRTRSGGGVRLFRRWTFLSEPRVDGLREDGPAEGKLREGDVLTAIDGVLITTREGARRFAGVSPGEAVTLTVRREGREIPVRITADAVCPESAPWPEARVITVRTPQAPQAPQSPTAPEPPEPAVAPEPATPPTPATRPRARAHRPLPKPVIPTEDALPRGWSGFGLTCRECGGAAGEAGEPPVWEFGTLPTIYFIDPGSPAARAGIQIGDVLTLIDGVSLLTEEGGRRFGALQPGQSVRWTIRRSGRERTATVVTERPPGDRAIPLEELREKLRELGEGQELERLSTDLSKAAAELERRGLLTRSRSSWGSRLRYAGVVGGSEIEVRGLGNVVVDDDGDEIVITTRDATIRIRPAAVPASAPAPREKERKR